MKLLTKEIEKRIPPLYSQENNPDPTCVVKFFTPWTSWTWFVIEGARDGDDWRFFGWVEGFDKELGYFGLKELSDINGPVGLKIERDLYFEPTKLSEVM